MNDAKPIDVKLGTIKNFGFYPTDVSKKYTTITKNKMAWNVLSILSDNEFTIRMGLFFGQISDALVERQPDIAVDEYGQSTTLNMLLKDFEIGELIVHAYNNGSSKILITDLGRKFLLCNTKS